MLQTGANAQTANLRKRHEKHRNPFQVELMIRSFSILLFVGWSLINSFPALADDPVSFRKDIAPILVQHCIACHGSKKDEGGYRVDTFDRLMMEGDSGGTGFTANDLDGSEAFRRMTSNDKEERMPLDTDALPAEQIALVKKWIKQGAKYDGGETNAKLTSIVPPPNHPDPPEVYPRAMPITAMKFSSDGSRLFVGGYHELTVWNVADGKLLRRIHREGQRTYAIDIGLDNKLIYAASGTPGRLGEVRVFEMESGSLVKVVATTEDVVLDLALNPAGDRLAVAGADNIARVFSAKSYEPQMELTSHSDWITAIAWNKDGTRIATASRDKTAKVFDATNGHPVITYAGHTDAVRGVAFHPSGNEVYSSSSDKTVHLWNISDGKRSAEVGKMNGEVFKLHAGGDFLFAPSLDSTVRKYKAADRQQVRVFSEHSDWVLTTAYDKSSNRLACGCFNGEIKIWDVEKGDVVTSFIAAPGK